MLELFNRLMSTTSFKAYGKTFFFNLSFSVNLGCGIFISVIAFLEIALLILFSHKLTLAKLRRLVSLSTHTYEFHLHEILVTNCCVVKIA